MTHHPHDPTDDASIRDRLESLVRDGLVQGVLDLTTTELADELVGGVLSAGPERMSAAPPAGSAAQSRVHGPFPASTPASPASGPRSGG